MATKSAVDQIVKGLAFFVEATPQDDTDQIASTSNVTPLNLKIRVRKKSKSDIQHGILSIPKQYNPKQTTERIRLISSDQTIISFNVFMESEWQKKPKRKPRRHFFGGCLGSQYDEDDEPYLSITSTTKITDSKILSKSEGVLKPNLIISETNLNDHKELARLSYNKKHSILGKCKPGGCLDPPYSEDKYSYKPKENRSSALLKDIIDESVTKEHKIYLDVGRQVKPKSKEIEDKSILSIYEANRFKKSVDTKYSDSIITYPPVESSSTNSNEHYKRKGLLSDENQINSVKEFSEKILYPVKINSKQKSSKVNDYEENKMMYENKIAKDITSENNHKNSVSNTNNKVLKAEVYNKNGDSNLERIKHLSKIHSETNNPTHNTTETNKDVSNIRDTITGVLIKQSRLMHAKSHSDASKIEPIRTTLNLNAGDDGIINNNEDLPKHTSIQSSNKTNRNDSIYENIAKESSLMLASLSDSKIIHNLTPIKTEFSELSLQTPKKISSITGTLSTQVLPVELDANLLTNQIDIRGNVKNVNDAIRQTSCENSLFKYLVLDAVNSNFKAYINNDISMIGTYANDNKKYNTEEICIHDSEIELLTRRKSKHESNYNKETIMDAAIIKFINEYVTTETSSASASITDLQYISVPNNKEMNHLDTTKKKTNTIPIYMSHKEPDTNDLIKDINDRDVVKNNHEEKSCDNSSFSPLELKGADSDFRVNTNNITLVCDIRRNDSINQNKLLLQNNAEETYECHSKISLLNQRKSSHENDNIETVMDRVVMDLTREYVSTETSGSLTDSQNKHNLPANKKKLKDLYTTQNDSKIFRLTDTIPIQVLSKELGVKKLTNPVVNGNIVQNNNNKDMCKKSCDSRSYFELKTNDPYSKVHTHNDLSIHDIFTNTSIDKDNRLPKNNTEETCKNIIEQPDKQYIDKEDKLGSFKQEITNLTLKSKSLSEIIPEKGLLNLSSPSIEKSSMSTTKYTHTISPRRESILSSKSCHETSISDFHPLWQTENQSNSFDYIAKLDRIQNLTINNNEIKNKELTINSKATTDIDVTSLIDNGHTVTPAINLNISDKLQNSTGNYRASDESISVNVRKRNVTNGIKKFIPRPENIHSASLSVITDDGTRELNSEHQEFIGDLTQNITISYSFDKSEKMLNSSKEIYRNSISSIKINQALSAPTQHEDGEQTHSNFSVSTVHNEENIHTKDTFNTINVSYHNKKVANREIPTLYHKITTLENDKTRQSILSTDFKDSKLRLKSENSFISIEKKREKVSQIASANSIQKSDIGNHQHYKDLSRNTNSSFSEITVNDNTTDYIKALNSNTKSGINQSPGYRISSTRLQYEEVESVSNSIVSKINVPTRYSNGNFENLSTPLNFKSDNILTKLESISLKEDSDNPSHEHDDGNQFINYIGSSSKLVSSKDGITTPFLNDLPAHIEYKNTQNNKDETNTSGKLNDPSPYPKGTLKKDILTIDIGFQSYVNSKNERVVKTFDTSNIPVHYPDEIITYVQSQVRRSSNEMRIAVDSDHDMVIRIKRFNSPLRVQIQEHDQADSNKYLRDKYDLANNTELYRKENIPGVSHQNYDNTSEIQTMLNVIYEKDLLPLQKAIISLKQEVEALISQGITIRDKPRNLTRIKPLRSSRQNKNCGCWKR